MYDSRGRGWGHSWFLPSELSSGLWLIIYIYLCSVKEIGRVGFFNVTIFTKQRNTTNFWVKETSYVKNFHTHGSLKQGLFVAIQHLHRFIGLSDL